MLGKGARFVEGDEVEYGFKPNTISVVSVLLVCANVEDEEIARKIHGYIVKVGLDFQVIIGNGSFSRHFFF